MMITVALLAVGAVLLGAAVPSYLRIRQERAAEEDRLVQEQELARTEGQEKAKTEEAARVEAERAEVLRDPVGAVLPAAIDGVRQLIPWWSRVTAADRARERADLEVGRAADRRDRAAADVPARHDTPAWRTALEATPYLLAVAVVIETVLNFRIFVPLTGAFLAPAVAVVAAGVLGGAAFAAGMAIRAFIAQRAERGHASYGTLVALLGGVAFAVASVAGMMWLAPARSAGPHDDAVAAAQGAVASATTRLAEDPTAERALAAAQARLEDAERLRDGAVTTDRIVVLGTSALEMGLVEMLLLGAPLRGRRRAEADHTAAERALAGAVEARLAAKTDYQVRLNPIVNQMIDHLVGHGLDVEQARVAVETAFGHTSVVEATGRVLEVIRDGDAEPAIDHRGHPVVAGELVTDPVLPGDDEQDQVLAETIRPTTEAVDDQVVELDDDAPAPRTRPSLDDLDMSS